MTDPASPDIKTLWQAQEQETDLMTLEQIHALVGKYDSRARKSAMVIPLGLAASTLILGMAWTRAPDMGSRAALALCFAGLIVMTVLVVRMVFPERDPAESAGAYLRRRLQVQMRKARGGWLVFIAPLIPGMVVSILLGFHRGEPAWAPILPLIALAAALVFAMVVNRRHARRLKADLDELDRLMGR